MIIQSHAPTRISLFGGGTDVAPFATRYGGVVISFAITLRQHITLYTDDDLFTHPYSTFPQGSEASFYYPVLDLFEMGGMHTISVKATFDGFIGAGLGSSSSAIVALVSALAKLKDHHMTKQEIAYRAWEIENKTLKLLTGKQDHYASSLGGCNMLDVTDHVVVSSYPKKFLEPFLPHMVLIYTGGTRKSSSIQKGFQEPSKNQIATLYKIKQLAIDADQPLQEGDVETIGRMLDSAWELKKESNSVTTPHIDFVYKRAMDHGAFGGKLLGAGEAGYMFFLVKEKKAFTDYMRGEGLEAVDFALDWQGVESRIL